MKILLLFALTLSSIFAIAQDDNTPIVVNISDYSSVSYKGSVVKRKAVVFSYQPIIYGSKDFCISVIVQYYVNNSGSYGNTVLADILADGTKTAEEKLALSQVYQDFKFEYSTVDKWVNASGDVVPKGTVGAVLERQYWQQFKLNQVSGMAATTALQGAKDAEYKIIAAIVAKLDTRKSW